MIFNIRQSIESRNFLTRQETHGPTNEVLIRRCCADNETLTLAFSSIVNIRETRVIRVASEKRKDNTEREGFRKRSLRKYCPCRIKHLEISLTL